MPNGVIKGLLASAPLVISIGDFGDRAWGREGTVSEWAEVGLSLAGTFHASSFDDRVTLH